ncbi:MAG: tRNA (adenosine(37)-N6)-threonylcarbamoyltransferase complex transferase subunit TsaD [Chloroflexi bacterium]|nr:tRNA (adenosine(37)-N6)-threonylcarbamoyltransferase complex transferase subunit TsaD [Chloroflexota bacterium]
MTSVLAIETSCDETAAAVVADGRRIRSNVVFSQDDLHRRFGGVVPELASRQHLLGIVPAIEKALVEAGIAWDGVDAVAVSHGPGLAGSLLVGVNAAKAIAFARGIPLVGVNHLEGHIYANWLTLPAGESGCQELHEPPAPEFPLLCLIVSGGHSELVIMTDHGRYRLLGRTRDDAAGEAFDKVARILGLGYPGGPAVQRAAAHAKVRDAGAPDLQLTRPWLRGTYDFSFSGIKTQVLRLAEGGSAGPVGNPSRLAQVAARAAPAGTSSDISGLLGRDELGRSRGAAPAGTGGEVSRPDESGATGRGGAAAGGEVTPFVAQLAHAFQEAVTDVLAGKACLAAEEFGVRRIALAGGVAANQRLREKLMAEAKVPVLIPDVTFCTDNAAMIAAAGYFRLCAGHTAGWDLDVYPNLRLA